jgi:uroporphyrinogen decarboxylase
MTPKERVLAAMNGEELYPIPSDVFENGVHWNLRAKLLCHFGLAEKDNEGLLKALDAHIRWCQPLYIGPPLEEDTSGKHTPIYPARRIVKDMWGTWGECAATYYDGLPRPLRDAETVADVEKHAWPNPEWFDYGQVGWLLDAPGDYIPVAEWGKRHSDYARLAGGWSALFARVLDLFGMEAALIKIAERPAVIEAAIAHIGNFHEEFYRRFARAGRGQFDILAWGDDYASQQSLLLRPELWRKWCLPIWKRLFAIAHENGMKAALHSCGSVRAVLPDLVDAGLDILENIQVMAVGMDPAELKRQFGKHLTFYGGMDTQEILPHGSPDEVRREVRRLIQILGEGGRYIFCTTHYLMDDVTIENVLAMHDEVRQYRP